MGLEKDTVCIILAAGKGTRMQSDRVHKVCFPIGGQPAINRIIGTFKSVGVNKFVVVVGDKAGQVIETIAADHPEVSYVFQGEQKGTGHAAQVAAESLSRLGFDGPVLITMGDKFIEPDAIREISESLVRGSADLVFSVAEKKDAPSAGRVILDESRENVLASIEIRDIQRAAILGKFAAAAEGVRSVPRETLRELAASEIPDGKKQARALGPVLAAMLEGDGSVTAKKLRDALGTNPGRISIGGRLMTAEEVEQSARHVNISVYLGRASAMYDALARLRPDNAQGEYYLPDIVTLLAGARDSQGKAIYKVRAHVVNDPADVLGFNNPQELLAIEDHLRRKSNVVTSHDAVPPMVKQVGKDRLKKVSAWAALFEKFGPKLKKHLREMYGDDEHFLQERRSAYLDVLKRFAQRYGGDPEVIIARAPGRINLMGRHVDHRGGHVNVMAINREVLLVAAPRSDDSVRMTHVEPSRFPDCEFSIGDMVGSMVWEDWLSYVNSRQVQQMVLNSRGDWSNYVKASTVRLQQQYREVRIHGMDLAVTGNIPMAAGLSSSSAVVVASAEACVALNRFDVSPQQFVDLCGEGEWFVGSRGGAADHAGIRMGRRGSVARVRFFPFEVEELYDFPPGHSLLVANSHIKAAKSDNARDQFNQRVAGYEFGFLMLRDRYPRLGHLMSHLRDVNPRRLGLAVSEIYRMLVQMPLEISPDQLKSTLSEEHADVIERVRGSHAAPEAYSIRETLLYGIAECERANLARDLLTDHRLVRFGELMARSHDGDRVAHCNVDDLAKVRCTEYRYDCSDSALRSLVADLHSQNPDRVLRAQLWMQPGGYRCSTPQIDQMVDLVTPMPGVVGAQLSGAGLGGCVMVLAEDDAVDAVYQRLVDGYYGPSNLEPAIEVCIPVQGSGLLSC